jgi:hypothetical protein
MSNAWKPNTVVAVSVQKTADSKRYISTALPPSPPAKTGDLWLNPKTGQTKILIKNGIQFSWIPHAG